MISQVFWTINLIFVIARLVLLHKDIGSTAEIRIEEKIVMARKLSARFIAEFPDDRELRYIASKKRSGSTVVIVFVALFTLIEYFLMDSKYERIALLVIAGIVVTLEMIRITQANDLRRYTKLHGIVADSEVAVKRSRYGETKSYRLVICYREPVGEVKARSISCDKETYDCIKLTKTCFVILDKGRVECIMVDDEV